MDIRKLKFFLNYSCTGDVFDRAGVVFMALEGQLEGEAVKEMSPDSAEMLLNAKYCTMGKHGKSLFY